jgi:hypothetical protein
MNRPTDPTDPDLAALTPAERRELAKLGRDYDRRSQAARRPGFVASWDRRVAAMQTQQVRREQ